LLLFEKKEEKFIQLVLETKPAQVTLVPDAENQLTSDHGWDTITHQSYLKEMITIFKNEGIRTSIFCDPQKAMIEGAKATGTDRIELYTEQYAKHFIDSPEKAIEPYLTAASIAKNSGFNFSKISLFFKYSFNLLHLFI
jgi:pyridoxine 5-phosphate synthase